MRGDFGFFIEYVNIVAGGSVWGDIRGDTAWIQIWRPGNNSREQFTPPLKKIGEKESISFWFL